MALYNELERLREIVGEGDDDAVLQNYLQQAHDAILNRMYPYMSEDEYAATDVPARYSMKKVRIAAYLMNKRGAEGESRHSENGVDRTYRSSDIPPDLLYDVLPCVGIPR